MARHIRVFGLKQAAKCRDRICLARLFQVCLRIQFTPIITHDTLYVRPFYLRPNNTIDNQVFARIFNGAAFPNVGECFMLSLKNDPTAVKCSNRFEKYVEHCFRKGMKPFPALARLRISLLRQNNTIDNQALPDFVNSSP